MRDVKNKTIVVLGAARSGIAVAKLLKGFGATCFVSDNAQPKYKEIEKKILDQEKIDYEFGGHSDKILKADFVVLSPGISKVLPVVQKILSLGTAVYSELEVASWYCHSPIIAITGSNGKTTTTTLLGKMLRTTMPQAIVAGNIGEPLAGFVRNSQASDWAVVEVSSFQLETIDIFHPKICVLLNLTPNHLDWYKTYEDYIEAKMRILKNMRSDDIIIYNADDPLLEKYVRKHPAKKIQFSLKDKSANGIVKDNHLVMNGQMTLNTSDLKLKGRHNYQNSLAAGLAAIQTGVSLDNIRTVLKSFRGVEHRLEYVDTIEEINFINDSKATTIESLAVALTSFKSPVILIAGGKDKGGDYSKLNKLISANVREAVLIGAAKDKMAHAWADLIPVHLSDHLEEAVNLAFSRARSGENILLSPACSSFDMFRDFEDRGNQFKKIIHHIINKK